MKKILLLTSAFFASISIHASEVMIDVPSLVGKSKTEISNLIGNPISCGDSQYGEKCLFEKAETEIVFIKGKADWLTVEGLDEFPFSDSTIEILGFEPQKATFTNAFSKRWEPLQDLVSVSLFKGARDSDYAYIKAYTE